MFVGRFPLRNNIYAALGPYDLANSQVSSYEMTTPKLLKQAKYESAMFGKFHLAGPDNNPDGNSTPLKLGWDYFYGWIRGGPVSIDTTAGGVAAIGTYGCGFVPGAANGERTQGHVIKLTATVEISPAFPLRGRRQASNASSGEAFFSQARRVRVLLRLD